MILAMVHYPEVLAKAHAQIDAVVGANRLPTFEDRAKLPYIDCIFKEVLRWGAAVPLSVYDITNLGLKNSQLDSASPCPYAGRYLPRLQPPERIIRECPHLQRMASPLMLSRSASQTCGECLCISGWILRA